MIRPPPISHLTDTLFPTTTLFRSIVSGKFVFACTEAYKIENGRLGDSIKGATLIGDGPSVLTKVMGIGSDTALDEGIGVCGKGGQSVPAGVGQPTLLVKIGRAHV